MGAHKQEMCGKGLHPMAGENLVFNKAGYRECKRCRYDRINARKKAKRAADRQADRQAAHRNGGQP